MYTPTLGIRRPSPCLFAFIAKTALKKSKFIKSAKITNKLRFFSFFSYGGIVIDLKEVKVAIKNRRGTASNDGRVKCYKSHTNKQKSRKNYH